MEAAQVLPLADDSILSSLELIESHLNQYLDQMHQELCPKASNNQLAYKSQLCEELHSEILLIGPPQSGKSTVIQVLTQMKEEFILNGPVFSNVLIRYMAVHESEQSYPIVGRILKWDEDRIVNAKSYKDIYSSSFVGVDKGMPEFKDLKGIAKGILQTRDIKNKTTTSNSFSSISESQLPVFELQVSIKKSMAQELGLKLINENLQFLEIQIGQCLNPSILAYMDRFQINLSPIFLLDLSQTISLQLANLFKLREFSHKSKTYPIVILTKLDGLWAKTKNDQMKKDSFFYLKQADQDHIVKDKVNDVACSIAYDLLTKAGIPIEQLSIFDPTQFQYSYKFQGFYNLKYVDIERSWNQECLKLEEGYRLVTGIDKICARIEKQYSQIIKSEFLQYFPVLMRRHFVSAILRCMPVDFLDGERKEILTSIESNFKANWEEWRVLNHPPIENSGETERGILEVETKESVIAMVLEFRAHIYDVVIYDALQELQRSYDKVVLKVKVQDRDQFSRQVMTGMSGNMAPRFRQGRDLKLIESLDKIHQETAIERQHFIKLFIANQMDLLLDCRTHFQTFTNTLIQDIIEYYVDHNEQLQMHLESVEKLPFRKWYSIRKELNKLAQV
ncbi:hypothetical protein FGO68_gene5801 [Halteria grandinella]|uniref:Uncharacterized protein n=1 Tax=Halteria grandinella TaxID=5974 RepID=A0A8J8NW44_HALGN|nr:hypothetical protein FGO68_gene5801 [Halteria grandinella]